MPRPLAHSRASGKRSREDVAAGQRTGCEEWERGCRVPTREGLRAAARTPCPPLRGGAGPRGGAVLPGPA
ncbi:hypothetical protein D7X55_25370, partial [Corallococcus sp. AB049A]